MYNSIRYNAFLFLECSVHVVLVVCCRENDFFGGKLIFILVTQSPNISYCHGNQAHWLEVSIGLPSLPLIRIFCHKGRQSPRGIMAS